MFNSIKTIFSTILGKKEIVDNSSQIDRLKKQALSFEVPNNSSSELDSINHKNQAVLVSQEASNERHHWPQANRGLASSALWGRTSEPKAQDRYLQICVEQARMQTGVTYNWVQG